MPIKTNGAPALGVNWSDDTELNGVTLKDGRGPEALDEVVIDKLTADNHDFEVGDEITIVFDEGPSTFTIVGLVGLGDTDGFGGATLAAFAPAFAPEILGAGDTCDTIDVRVDEARRCRRRAVGDRERVARAHRGRDRPGGRRRSVRLDQRDHLDLRDRPVDLRLRHRLHRRLHHQQHLRHHDRPTAA